MFIGPEPVNLPSELRAGDICRLLRRPTMISPVVKRSIVLAGHKTSVSLEHEFWKALKGIAIARGTSLSNLVTSIDVERGQGNLSSCLRLFVLDSYRNRVSAKMSARDEPANVTETRQTNLLSDKF
jgi:predicted DNA-binding ribbon-helix-helix protein